MGNSDSAYDSTDWDAANGGLTSASQCLSNSCGPTESKKTLTLIKTGVRDRIFEVKGEDGKTLFTTGIPTERTEIPGTNFVPWFGLFGPNGEKMCRIDSDQGTYLKEWIVFLYEPAYTGQEPDAVETKQVGVSMYRKAKILIADQVVDARKDHATVTFYTEGGKETEPILLLNENRRVTPASWETSLPNGGGLVAYWKWANTITVHKVELELAKGTDMALHSILVVLTNLVRRGHLDKILGGNIKY